MDYGQLTRDLVADAFQNKLPGLNVKVTFHWVLTQGDYNPETEQYEQTTANSEPVPCVMCRPEFDEVRDGMATAKDHKLLIPGKLIAHEIDDETTATMNGKLWKVKKGKGVPGDSLVIAFLQRT